MAKKVAKPKEAKQEKGVQNDIAQEDWDRFDELMGKVLNGGSKPKGGKKKG